MEYILEETNLFDLNLLEKVENIIEDNNLVAENDSIYDLEVTFNVELLKDEEMKNFCIKYIPEKYNRTSRKGNKKDYINAVLQFTLDNIADIFIKNNFKFSNISINGDSLDSMNTIKINLSKSESYITDKKGEPFKVYSVIPSSLYIQKVTQKIVSEKLNNRFDDYMDIVKDPKIMAQILDIPDTTDENILFKEFINQYANLFRFHMEGEEDELHKEFSKKAQEVYDKYYKDTK